MPATADGLTDGAAAASGKDGGADPAGLCIRGRVPIESVGPQIYMAPRARMGTASLRAGGAWRPGQARASVLSHSSSHVRWVVVGLHGPGRLLATCALSIPVMGASRAERATLLLLLPPPPKRAVYNDALRGRSGGLAQVAARHSSSSSPERPDRAKAKIPKECRAHGSLFRPTHRVLHRCGGWVVRGKVVLLVSAARTFVSFIGTRAHTTTITKLPPCCCCCVSGGYLIRRAMARGERIRQPPALYLSQNGQCFGSCLALNADEKHELKRGRRRSAGLRGRRGRLPPPKKPAWHP